MAKLHSQKPTHNSSVSTCMTSHASVLTGSRFRLLRMIASRVRTELDTSHKNLVVERSRGNINLKNVAILPVSRNIPVDAFARKLHAALEAIGAPTAFLNQASVSDHLGRHAFTRMGKLKAAGWLAEQEQKYRIVLYVADSTVNSAWTQTCIRQVGLVIYSLRISVHSWRTLGGLRHGSGYGRGSQPGRI